MTARQIKFTVEDIATDWLDLTLDIGEAVQLIEHLASVVRRSMQFKMHEGNRRTVTVIFGGKVEGL